MITREQQIYDPPSNWLAALGRRIIAATQGTGRALMLLLGRWRMCRLPARARIARM